jgi:hypothetical protein
MYNSCEVNFSTFFPLLSACYQYVDYYYLGVNTSWGQDAYDAAQKETCECYQDMTMTGTWLFSVDDYPQQGSALIIEKDGFILFWVPSCEIGRPQAIGKNQGGKVRLFRLF